jgi:hypothetical protein
MAREHLPSELQVRARARVSQLRRRLEAAVRILALDTGGTTGAAIWQDEEIWSAALADPDVEEFMRVQIPLADLVITEQLVISMATIKKGRQIQRAIELVGVARYLCRQEGVELYDRSKPGEVMGFATDDKLKRIGWYVPGPDHERDARRHILTWLCDHGMFDLRRLLSQ